MLSPDAFIVDAAPDAATASAVGGSSSSESSSSSSSSSRSSSSSGPGGADSKRATLRAAASTLLEHGVVQLRSALPTEALLTLRGAHDRRLEEVLAQLAALRAARLLGNAPREASGGGEPAAPSEFEVACVRDGARLDLVGIPAPAAALDEVEAAWLPLVRALLGPGLQRLWVGSFVALPASERCGHQPWHADAPQLFHVPLPPHALNVFVPLADVDLDAGPTEFRPGSHLAGSESEDSVALCSRAGDVIVYDYRVWHRGLANCSDAPRRVMYFTYAKPWWRDANKGASTAGM